MNFKEHLVNFCKLDKKKPESVSKLSRQLELKLNSSLWYIFAAIMASKKTQCPSFTIYGGEVTRH